MDSKLVVQIENFFNNCDLKDSLTISFVRDDGIILYSNFHNEMEAKSIGALVGGVWQAARSLASFASKQDVMDFRLSYDTSSDGIMIYPLTYGNTHYYLCGIYKDEINPAVIKQKLRLLQGSLMDYFVEKVVSEDEKRDGFLFDNITDEEMDGLFTVTGN